MLGLLGIGGADSGVDVGDIGHSLRFRDSVNAYISKNWTQGTDPNDSSQYKRFISFKVKRGKLGAIQLIASNTLTTNGNYAWQIYFDENDKLNLWTNSVTGTLFLTSNMVFRDPTSHYYIDIAHDVTQATASARTTIWVNGNVITTTGTAATQNNQDDGLYMCPPLAGTWGARIGNSVMNGVGVNQFGGYVSRFCVVDNPSGITAASFGYFNSTINEWVSKTQSEVKAVVDAGGTNSFMLDFDNGTSLTTLGYDKSSKGNNWTLNNFSLTAGSTYDWMLDVPGNSFATLNPINKGPSVTISDGALSSTNANFANSTMPAAGLAYWEVIQTGNNATYPYIGVSGNRVDDGSGLYTYDPVLSYNPNNGNLYKAVGTVHATYATTAMGTPIRFAYNSSTRKLWVGNSSGWFNSGDPAAGTGEVYTLPGVLDVFPAVGTYPSAGVTFNFGQYPFHSSAVYDAASGGYFRYTPPSGFKALCQANMATPALKPTDAFVAVNDTQANIVATLAAARSGWSAYVDVFKNRAAAENWGWRFSHDSGNEYSVTTNSVVRQANRAMAGANLHEGFSIRIGSAYGTAAGSVAHNTGSATTVTHNLGTSRQMILLFPRTSGTAIKTYLPTLTTGKLVDLSGGAIETTDSSITSIGSNSFQIGSGMATMTYDYLVISEIDGLNRMFSYQGNASADGTLTNSGGKTVVTIVKNKDYAGARWNFHSGIRDPNNPVGHYLSQNYAEAEDYAGASIWRYDFLSNGFKAREYTPGDVEFNYPGYNFVGIAYNSVAAKYSLAR